MILRGYDAFLLKNVSNFEKKNCAKTYNEQL